MHHLGESFARVPRLLAGLTVLLTLLTGAWFYSTRTAEPPCRQPCVVLWAWERPERLGFIAPGEIAVAYLAKTIVLGPVASVRPRMQPLDTLITNQLDSAS